ncbi:hypothetical protein BH23CHL1_BH23CHL1_04350 [soil metagenome]
MPNVELLLAAKGHRLVGLVGAPGPRSRRTDDYLTLGQYARPGLNVIVSNYPNRWATMIRPLRPDLIVCFGFNWKIPASVLEVTRLGTINGHDGLLPKYRGRCATGWALRNGDKYGFTFHYMGSDFDTGPILSQRRISVSDDDYSFLDIWPRLEAAIQETFLEALDRVAVGDPGIVQDETLATTAPGAVEPEWRFLDWNKPARDTFIQVRSWYGARGVPHGTLAQIDGRQVLITATRLIGQQSNDAAPGTVLERRDVGSLLVQCDDGPLEILIWREGPPMSANGSGAMDPLLVAVSDPS